MDGRQAQLVTSSYQALSPELPRVVERFYIRLFEAAPPVRALFPADMSKLRGHLAASIAIMARNAGQLAVMAPSLRDLGRRHAAYGATEDHYPVVAQVLLSTLADAAGDRWTPETAAAWSQLVHAVADEMMAGARLAANAPSQNISAKR